MKRNVILLTACAAAIFLGGWLAEGPSKNQGYAPIQPLTFSNKLHAGQYQVPCMYCHSSVERSRHATVPAMNVCMNCHKVVKTYSPLIQKITEAYKRNQPIK